MVWPRPPLAVALASSLASSDAARERCVVWAASANVTTHRQRKAFRNIGTPVMPVSQICKLEVCYKSPEASPWVAPAALPPVLCNSESGRFCETVHHRVGSGRRRIRPTAIARHSENQVYRYHVG